MRSFLVFVSLSLLICMVYSNGYFPVSSRLETCCSDPVHAFIMREFSGDCACQTLEQKWKRYVDWVEIEGGYIHPFIEMNYVGRYQDTKQTKSKHKHQYDHFRMHSHERGIFVNIQQKYRHKIESKALLMQIPFSISFSQFIISKYIKNASEPRIHNPQISAILLSKPHHFMPDGFPDWQLFRARSIKTHHINSIRGWLALGLAWLKQNTRELLPWLELLPSPHYLPITWDMSLRDELLAGTKAWTVVHQLQTEYNTALPYIHLLGLTKTQVKEAFAWIASRSFGMGFDAVGGAHKSPVIPCGIDFFNHDVFGDSSIYYDKSFGERTQNKEILDDLVLNHKGHVRIREIDFASSFMWINNAFMNASEMFVNYGKHHTSGARLALFGFIDEIHPYDHYSVLLDVQRNDLHFDIKKEYFETVWNTKYDTETCFIQYNTSTWNGLGTKRYVENKQRRVFAPPLTMEYYGQKVIKVQGNFIKFLRLIYLPQQHFDSFTISAILNDFEYDYLENIIDPLIGNTLNHICSDLLHEFPRTVHQDQLELHQIERERQWILNELSWNRNRNLTETQRLSDVLSSLDRYSVVLQYRVREKTYLSKCSTLYIEAIPQYLDSVKRRKTLYTKGNRKKRKLVSSDGLRDLLQTAFNLGSFISLDSSVNHSIDRDELSRETRRLLESVHFDLELFDDDTAWTDLIESLIDDHEAKPMENGVEDTVSKEQLMIGEPKKGKTLMDETIGWNSPNAITNTQTQTITLSNLNGQPLDLTQLFGGNGGNIQINNGQIIIGNNAVRSGNVNNNNLEIPETVPFSQIMNQATVSVFSLDGNGNIINVGNNNLAQLFNRKKDKPKIQP